MPSSAAAAAAAFSTAQLGIVIPVYNEADSIIQVLESIEEQTPVRATVYVVGDSEEDNTFAELSKFQGRMVDVRPLINGYGAGALQAIKWGLHSSNEAAVLVTMADVSDDMLTLKLMWEEFQNGFAVVCGSRYMEGGKQIGGPWFKTSLSRLAGVSLHYLTGLPTKDVTNSFKLYSRAVIDDITIESTGGFEIGMEIVVKAWSSGFPVTEVPTVWKDRALGDSRFKLLAWLPRYLHWYLHCIRHAWL